MAAMDVHQISVQFVAAEDRLMLRVSTHDGEMVGAWITRRLLRGLWSPLDRLLGHVQVGRERPQAIVHPEARRMLAQATRDKVLAAADFDTEFQSGALLPALGERPLLVTEVQLKPTDEGLISILWRDAEGRELALNLAPDAATALQEMLSRAVQQADWRLDMAAPAGVEPGDSHHPARLLN